MTVLEQGVRPVEVARQLAPELSRRAEEGEARATMPPDLVRRIRCAGLFRLALPPTLGGLEVDPATILTVIEELSRADGSAGWTILIGNSTAFFAWLEPDVARALIGGNPDIVSGAMFAPLGRAVPDLVGGFKVEGRWPFFSGCPHADWLQAGVHVFDGDRRRFRADGQPDWRFAFVPREAGEIVNTWNAAGLRGTGSHDVVMTASCVPEEHTASPFFEPARHDGPLWRLRFVDLLAVFLAGFPLGVARRALDEFAQLAPSKRRGFAPGPFLAEDSHVQVELGRAEGALLAARAFVFDATGQAWEAAVRGEPPSPHQGARLQLAMRNAMAAGVVAVDTAFQLSGASAVYSHHPLQRCVRDIRTAGQHMAFSTAGYTNYAKHRFGLGD